MINSLETKRTQRTWVLGHVQECTRKLIRETAAKLRFERCVPTQEFIHDNGINAQPTVKNSKAGSMNVLF